MAWPAVPVTRARPRPPGHAAPTDTRAFQARARVLPRLWAKTYGTAFHRCRLGCCTPMHQPRHAPPTNTRHELSSNALPSTVISTPPLHLQPPPLYPSLPSSLLKKVGLSFLALLFIVATRAFILLTLPCFVDKHVKQLGEASRNYFVSVQDSNNYFLTSDPPGKLFGTPITLPSPFPPPP